MGISKKTSLFRILVVVLLLLSRISVNATEQEPDYLIYNGVKYELGVGWAEPSPLQMFYIRMGKKTPFDCLSRTSNYRAHIATWEIRDSSLYLVSVIGLCEYYLVDTANGLFTYKDTLSTPNYFGISSLSGVAAEDGAVLADWFSGILAVRTSNDKNLAKVIIFQIHNGKLLKKKTIEPDDWQYISAIMDNEVKKPQKHTHIRIKSQVVYKKLRANGKSRADSVPSRPEGEAYKELVEKYYMMRLWENYKSFYFHSSQVQDKVKIGKKKGCFYRQSYLPVLLAMYDNDPIRFPFNWENADRNGAPAGKWVIRKGSLYLKKVELESGLEFYADYITDVSLSELFPPEGITRNGVLAYWVSGDYIVEYGNYVKDDFFGMKEFKVTQREKITFEAGKVVKRENLKLTTDYGGESD